MVIAEDVAIIRAGIISLLRDDGMTIVGEATDYESELSAVVNKLGATTRRRSRGLS